MQLYFLYIINKFVTLIMCLLLAGPLKRVLWPWLLFVGATITNEPDIHFHCPGPPLWNNDILSEILITEDEVYDQLSIIDKSKPPDQDGISPRVLKEKAFSIESPPTKLFNMSLVEKNYQIFGNSSRLHPCIRTKLMLKKISN